MDADPLFKLAHVSDIHFGRIAHEGVVGALVDEVNAAGVHLVAISGDLTQRARTREFEAAKAMIDAFEAPVLVVPGNHDVRAWWHNPFERIFQSAKRFRKHIGDETTPQFVSEGLAVFGLNSAHGLTIKGGKIRPRHLGRMKHFFTARPAGTFNVLVVHHHLTFLRDLGPHDVAQGAEAALKMAGESSVDLVLCGHLHRSYVGHVDVDIERGQRIVIASAGTATSSRGRGEHRNVNFYNHVHVWADHFVVEERRFEPETGRFVPERSTRFERQDAA